MNHKIARILEIANEFLDLPSSIGYEKPFLDYLNKKILNLGYETILNERFLAVKPKNEKSKHLFSVHIDRHAMAQNAKGEIEYLGFYLKKKSGAKFKRENIQKDELKLVTKLQKDGYSSTLDSKFLKIGKDDINLKFIREGGAEFFEKVGLRYVNAEAYSYRPENGKRLNRFKIERCDINHKIPLIKYQLNPVPRENDTVFSMISRIKVYDDLFYGQIDNVISAAVVFYLLESGNFCDEVIFTTQEEIGNSWECVTKYLENHHDDVELIVLDTTPYENFNNLKDGTIVLRRGDENGMFSVKLLEEIEKCAIKNNIPRKFKSSDIGSTELGRIVQHTNGKFNGTTIQLPSMNYHTLYETSTISSLKNYLKIIKNLSKR